MGSSSDAFLAGQRPKPIPTATENVVARTVLKTETFVTHPAKNDRTPRQNPQTLYTSLVSTTTYKTNIFFLTVLLYVRNYIFVPQVVVF